MSGDHLQWAWKKATEHKLKPATTLLLIRLADSAYHDTGVATWNSPQTLADYVRVSRASLYRHLGELKSLGLVRHAQIRLKSTGVCTKLAFWVNPAPSPERWPIEDWKAGFDLTEDGLDINAASQFETDPPSHSYETPSVSAVRRQVNPLLINTPTLSSSLRSEERDLETASNRKRSTGALAADAARLEALWQSATATMRKRSESKQRVMAAARPVVAKLGGWDVLVAAMKRYVQSADVKAGLGQPGIQRWLQRGLYEQFLTEPEPDKVVPFLPAWIRDAAFAKPKLLTDMTKAEREWFARCADERGWGDPPGWATNVVVAAPGRGWVKRGQSA